MNRPLNSNFFTAPKFNKSCSNWFEERDVDSTYVVHANPLRMPTKCLLPFFVQGWFLSQCGGGGRGTCSARFWLKKLLAQVHATQNIYLHNIISTCTKEGLNKENTTQIAKYKKNSDLIPWKFVEMSNFFEFLFISKFVTKKLHAQCACRLENLLAQRKKCMHLCKCACVKSTTGDLE